MLVEALLVLLLSGGSPAPARADDPAPDRYPEVAFLRADLAAAIPIAAKRAIKPLGEPGDAFGKCMGELQSFNVHVSVENDVITVVFRPNKRCGEGIKDGGSRVTLDAKTLKILSVRGDG